MVTCFIGFGSNFGNRKTHFERALFELKSNPFIQVIKTSRPRQTKAITLPGETHPDYLNGVAEIETTLTPEALLKLCKAIEQKMGRLPSSKRWQARPIDLDILFYGDHVLETPALQIPHPLLHERRFVLEPLQEIAPDFVHPILKKTVAEIYRDVIKVSQ